MRIVLDTNVLISGVLLRPKFRFPLDYIVAVAGPADYLVTGNVRHFPSTPLVMSPRDFLNVLLGTA